MAAMLPRAWKAFLPIRPLGPADGPKCLVLPGFLASDRSTAGGSMTGPARALTVSLRRHSVSSAAMGSPGAPPRTAAVIAPIDTPVTATGRNPGRCS